MDEGGAVRGRALAGVLAVAALLGALGWLGWRTLGGEPRWSVARMGHAYTSHDWERFERYVDVEAVMAAGIDELVEELRGEGPPGRLGQELVESQRALIVERAREGLRAAVERGEAEEGWLRRQRGILAPLRMRVLERTGDEALVLLDTDARYGDVEARMVPREGRWVVVEVPNLGGLLSRGAPAP
ncbi:MAG: hypothetical protein IBX62_04250 [Coriobacteriia bacterium]|nr:hypothetical protein [Coriobacteriia bacterium]